MAAPDPRATGWLVPAVFGDPAEAGGPAGAAADRARRVAAWGVLAAAVACVLVAGLRSIGTPAFAPPDETAHVAYALAILDWEIPHIATFPEELPVPGMVEGLSVWTANHPPAPYAVMAVPLGLGDALGRPLVGFHIARLLNALAAGGAVLLSARIAATVAPHRPRLVVGTAAVIALIPYAAQVAGTAYTDGLALLPAVGILALAVDVLVRGPSRARLLWLVGLAAVAALSRVTTLVLVLLAGGAWAAAQLLHRPARRRPARSGCAAPLRRGVGGAAAMGAAAAAAGGWFYAGNARIYGDPTGSAALFALHDRQPPGGALAYWLDPMTYRFQIQLLWARIEGLPEPAAVLPGDALTGLVRAVVVVLLVGAVAVGWAAWRRRGAGIGRSAAAGVLLAVWYLALAGMMAQFVAGGGAPHARYLWPALTGPVLLLAVGLDVIRLPLPGGRRPLPIGGWAGLAALVWANAYAWPRALAVWEQVDPGLDGVDAAVDVLAARGVGGAGYVVVLLIAALVLAVGTTGWSLWAAPRLLRGEAGTDVARVPDVVRGSATHSTPDPARPAAAEDAEAGSDGHPSTPALPS